MFEPNRCRIAESSVTACRCSGVSAWAYVGVLAWKKIEPATDRGYERSSSRSNVRKSPRSRKPGLMGTFKCCGWSFRHSRGPILHSCGAPASLARRSLLAKVASTAQMDCRAGLRVPLCGRKCESKRRSVRLCSPFKSAPCRRPALHSHLNAIRRWLWYALERLSTPYDAYLRFAPTPSQAFHPGGWHALKRFSTLKNALRGGAGRNRQAVELLLVRRTWVTAAKHIFHVQ